MPKEFIIDSDSQFIIEFTKLQGQFRVTLDGQEIFDFANQIPPFPPCFRILAAGDHRLDMNAKDHAGKTYDVQFTLKVTKGTKQTYSRPFQLQNSGDPGDTLAGKTLLFSAIIICPPTNT